MSLYYHAAKFNKNQYPKEEFPRDLEDTGRKFNKSNVLEISQSIAAEIPA